MPPKFDAHYGCWDYLITSCHDAIIDIPDGIGNPIGISREQDANGLGDIIRCADTADEVEIIKLQ